MTRTHQITEYFIQTHVSFSNKKSVHNVFATSNMYTACTSVKAIQLVLAQERKIMQNRLIQENQT